MIIMKALKLGDEYLRKRNIDNSLDECKIMLEDMLDIPRSELLIRYKDKLPLKDLIKYYKRVKRRGKYEPMDYIIGHKPFMGMDIKVTRDVLIPRDDTETVINEGIKVLKDYGKNFISEDELDKIKFDIDVKLSKKDYANLEQYEKIDDENTTDNNDDRTNAERKINAKRVKTKDELIKERHISEFEFDDEEDLENDDKLDENMERACRLGNKITRLTKEQVEDITVVIDEDNVNSYKARTAKNKIYYDDIVTNRVNDITRENSYEIIDMCTGSGIIGLSLARFFKNSHVFLCDISDKALDIAKFNAQRNKVENVTITKTDMFSFFDDSYNNTMDMIISNPPYIKTDICKTLEPEVKDYEPMLALDGGYDGLDFYKIIIKEAKRLLKDNGLLVLEIDYTYFKELMPILKDNNFIDIECTKDMNNLDRCIVARLKK